MKKVLIDLSTFSDIHSGGKDEVSYSLLKQFSRMGLTSNFVISGNPLIEPIIHQIDPDYLFEPLVIMPFSVENLREFASDNYHYGLQLNSLIKKHNVSALVYTNKFPSVLKVNAVTIGIPHDMQSLNYPISFDTNVDENNFWFSVFTRETYAKCDHIIAISDFDKNNISTLFPEVKSKLKRIYDPIIFPSIDLSVPKEYITAINIQWPHKNIGTLIKAYSFIAKQTDLKLALVGREPDDIDLFRQMVSDLGIADRVLFTGFLDDNHKSDILNKTQLYVNPSKFEGFGMTAVEVIGSGIPTIVGDVAANREVTQGLCTYYSPVEDSNKLAETMLHTLANMPREETLLQAAKAMKARYSLEIIAQEYIDFFQSVTE